MDAKTNIQQFVQMMRNIEVELLEFIDKENSENDDFHNLITLFQNNQIFQDKHKLKTLLHLISNISSNHHRSLNFFSKIELILLQLINEIQRNFTSDELFIIFENNKRIILFLLEQKILIFDEKIKSIIQKSSKLKEMSYNEYFSIEINGQPHEETDLLQLKQNRANGENESYLCQLIREDSIDEFIIFVNQKNLSLFTTINNSIYETNSFLIGKQPTLIEYAAFFGSIQIFRYLYLNKNELLSPSLWSYVIHGRNPEMIHFLEENQIKPFDESYKSCLIQSIECHHNEISNYIIDNLLQKNEFESSVESTFIPVCLENSNFYSLIDFNNFEEGFVKNIKIFMDLCRFDYFPVVKYILSDKSLNLQSVIVYLYIIV